MIIQKASVDELRDAGAGPLPGPAPRGTARRGTGHRAAGRRAAGRTAGRSGRRAAGRTGAGRGCGAFWPYWGAGGAFWPYCGWPGCGAFWPYCGAGGTFCPYCGAFWPYCGSPVPCRPGSSEPGCVGTRFVGTLAAGSRVVRIRRLDWRSAHERSFAFSTSGSATGFRSLPCPQHGSVPTVPLGGRREDHSREVFAEPAAIGQGRPRAAANQLCELGTHISTVAARLARKPSQLPPLAGRETDADDGQQQ